MAVYDKNRLLGLFLGQKWYYRPKKFFGQIFQKNSQGSPLLNFGIPWSWRGGPFPQSRKTDGPRPTPSVLAHLTSKIDVFDSTLHRGGPPMPAFLLKIGKKFIFLAKNGQKWPKTAHFRPKSGK